MTLRIITEQELREALARGLHANEDRVEALDQIENLRGFILKSQGVIKVDHSVDPYFDPHYALELLDEVKAAIEDSWPIAVDRETIYERSQ